MNLLTSHIDVLEVIVICHTHRGQFSCIREVIGKYLIYIESVITIEFFYSWLKILITIISQAEEIIKN